MRSGDAAAAANGAGAATARLVDLRGDELVRAGAVAWESPDTVTGWHRHPYHQLECALTGVLEVECPDGQYLLPPHQAVWIPAGLAHNSTLCGVSAISLFLHPGDLTGSWARAQVVPVAPILREVLAYARRWPLSRGHEEDDWAATFFPAATALVREALRDELPYRLPVSDDHLTRAILEATRACLPTANLHRVCREVGISPRALRRRLRAHLGMTWEEYLTRARVLRGMALLVTTDRTVLDIATELGYAGPSGFTRAFTRVVGTTASAYRAAARDRAG